MGSGANRLFTVDFDTFSKILNRPGGFREPFDIEEYIRGFQVFDKDRSGFVGKGQIKYILTNLGEKMSEEEVDELFKSTIDASNDEVDYRGKLPCDTPIKSRNWVLTQNRVRQDDRRELETEGQWMSYVFTRASCLWFQHADIGVGILRGHGSSSALSRGEEANYVAGLLLRPQ